MPVNTAIAREYFYCQKNAAKLANTAMPMFLTSCETEIHIRKYGRGVGVATLLKKKYASILRVMS